MNKLIEQLNRIDWTEFETIGGTTAKGTHEGRAIDLKVTYKLNTVKTLNSQDVQATLSISVDGIHAYRWDMDSAADLTPFRVWFLTMEDKLKTVNFRMKDKEREEAKDFFNSI